MQEQMNDKQMNFVQILLKQHSKVYIILLNSSVPAETNICKCML